MDLVARCKGKLTHFRVKELKDVLTQLGLSKQGRKQDLLGRILAFLSNEHGSGSKRNDVGRDEVAKLVDDTYRKMKVCVPADLTSKLQGLTNSANVKFKEEIVDSYQMVKTRCLCGSPRPTDLMIKCEDPMCNVRQHVACVVIPEEPRNAVPPNPPEIYYCETCRLSRADPFWTTVAHPLCPVKLNIISAPVDGSNPGLGIVKVFELTRADRDLLSKEEYDVQAWCMLLNDKVTYRMQWPQHANLLVNGVSVRAINRPVSQQLGAHGRDDGPIITQWARDGINKISLTAYDARIFCVGVRIVKRRTLHQILSLIPKEAEGESFEDALTRVRKCIGGGATTENAVSDNDIEIVADFISVNLRCPMSGLRLKVAGRFKQCAHMGCFDLEVFVEMNQRSKKWQCPICLKNYSWETIIIDPYFNRITSKMLSIEDDVAEIELKPDGSWRVKAEFDRRKGLGDLVQWHLPVGTLCDPSEVESKPESDLKPVIQEIDGDFDAALKPGIKKFQNGTLKSNNRFHKNLGSSTGSGRNGEGGNVYESKSLNINPPPGFNSPTTAPSRDPVVIVLSDSEEDYNNDAPATNGIRPQAPHNIIADSCYENPAPVTDYNPNDPDEFGSSMYSLPHGEQVDTGLPSFDLMFDIHSGTVPAENVSSSERVLQSKDGALDLLAGHAISLGMNSKTRKRSRVRSDRPSSLPNQERSVKPRVYVTIDSD